MAAQILKCGESRIWIDPNSPRVKQAITRKDVRNLIKDKIIRKKPSAVKKTSEKKRKRGPGSRKGAAGARTGKKSRWLKTVRPQRVLLRQLKAEGKISNYRKVYRLIKGNMFRSKQHLIAYLQEHGMMKADKETEQKEKLQEGRK